MAEDLDKFWKETKGKLRRAANLDPMCREEAEDEIKRAKPNKPMAEGDIDSIMQFVLSWGDRGGLVAEPDAAEADEEDHAEPGGWVDPVTPEMMEEELLQLNSNAGEKDDETEALLDKLRREALGDDTADDENAPRLGYGEDAAGKGD
jgi:hypothetical protein